MPLLDIGIGDTQVARRELTASLSVALRYRGIRCRQGGGAREREAFGTGDFLPTDTKVSWTFAVAWAMLVREETCEEYRVLLPFIEDGFACGDKAVHIVNPHQRDGRTTAPSAAV